MGGSRATPRAAGREPGRPHGLRAETRGAGGADAPSSVLGEKEPGRGTGGQAPFRVGVGVPHGPVGGGRSAGRGGSRPRRWTRRARSGAWRGARAARREEARAWPRWGPRRRRPCPPPSGARGPLTQPGPGQPREAHPQRGRRSAGGDGAGGSAPPAGPRGRSRTRRRSALGGVRPAPPRGRLGTPAPARPGGPQRCAGQDGGGTLRTGAPRVQTFTVLFFVSYFQTGALSPMLCSCTGLCDFPSFLGTNLSATKPKTFSRRRPKRKKQCALTPSSHRTPVGREPRLFLHRPVPERAGGPA